jgi:hypothetical protein
MSAMDVARALESLGPPRADRATQFATLLRRLGVQEPMVERKGPPDEEDKSEQEQDEHSAGTGTGLVDNLNTGTAPWSLSPHRSIRTPSIRLPITISTTFDDRGDSMSYSASYEDGDEGDVGGADEDDNDPVNSEDESNGLAEEMELDERDAEADKEAEARLWTMCDNESAGASGKVKSYPYIEDSD